MHDSALGTWREVAPRAWWMLAALGFLLGAASCRGRTTGPQDEALELKRPGHDPCNPPTTILVKHLVPPAQNPYPPADALAQKRVALATETIRAFYTTRLDQAALAPRANVPHDAGLDDFTKGPDAFEFQLKSADCLGNLDCWSKDYPFLKRVIGLASSSPPWLVKRTLWAHVVPWSLRRYAERALPPAEQHLNDDFKISEAQKHDYAGTSEPLVFILPPLNLRPDEYLVDAVVEMRGKPGWFHLVHVLADDAAGEPGLRWFELLPIQDLTRPSCSP